MQSVEGLPGGSLFPCSLPKLPYVPMFPHSLRMFSYCNFVMCCKVSSVGYVRVVWVVLISFLEVGMFGNQN